MFKFRRNGNSYLGEIPFAKQPHDKVTAKLFTVLVPASTEQLKPPTSHEASYQALKAMAFRARLPRWIACLHGSALADSL